MQVIDYKTKPCDMKSCCKEKSNCFKYHDGVDKRRPVFSYTGALNYKPILCPNISLYSNINTPLLEKEHSLKHRVCPFLDDCNYSHNNYEIAFHPDVYKKKPCLYSLDKYGHCPALGKYCWKQHLEETYKFHCKDLNVWNGFSKTYEFNCFVDKKISSSCKSPENCRTFDIHERYEELTKYTPNGGSPSAYGRPDIHHLYNYNMKNSKNRNGYHQDSFCTFQNKKNLIVEEKVDILGYGTRGYGSKDSEFLNKELSNEKIKKNIMQKKMGNLITKLKLYERHSGCPGCLSIGASSTCYSLPCAHILCHRCCIHNMSGSGDGTLLCPVCGIKFNKSSVIEFYL